MQISSGKLTLRESVCGQHIILEEGYYYHRDGAKGKVSMEQCPSFLIVCAVGIVLMRSLLNKQKFEILS